MLAMLLESTLIKPKRVQAYSKYRRNRIWALYSELITGTLLSHLSHGAVSLNNLHDDYVTSPVKTYSNLFLNPDSYSA